MLAPLTPADFIGVHGLPVKHYAACRRVRAFYEKHFLRIQERRLVGKYQRTRAHPKAVLNAEGKAARGVGVRVEEQRARSVPSFSRSPFLRSEPIVDLATPCPPPLRREAAASIAAATAAAILARKKPRKRKFASGRAREVVGPPPTVVRRPPTVAVVRQPLAPPSVAPTVVVVQAPAPSLPPILDDVTRGRVNLMLWALSNRSNALSVILPPSDPLPPPRALQLQLAPLTSLRLNRVTFLNFTDVVDLVASINTTLTGLLQFLLGAKANAVAYVAHMLDTYATAFERERRRRVGRRRRRRGGRRGVGVGNVQGQG